MAESIVLDKAKDFAVEIINICKSIKETKRESVLTNQLMRSGTSIGANIHESKYAHGTADFISKMQIALKVMYTYSVGENCRKYYEEQILLVDAKSFDEAYEKAKKYIAVYDIEHKNPQGELVQTEKVELLDCFLAFDEEEDVQEVYSSTMKNQTSLSEEEFYQTITNQCDDEEMYALRYEEFN